MGSSLYLNRTDAYGIKRPEEIWGTDLQANVRFFRQYAHRLNPTAPSFIEPGVVLPYIGKWKRTDVYQPLMEFCSDKRAGLGLTQGKTFFPFAYNWLADNRETAKKLADFIRSVSNNQDRFCFIAHSMGGIVVRLMLLENLDIAQRTNIFFQIATPILGSAKAYYSIKRYPQLNPIFDGAWQFFQKAENRGELQKALERCYSLYQLLPPPQIMSLDDEGGTYYSALDRRVWHSDLHQYVDAAIDVHQKLAQSDRLKVKIKCIYSPNHSTPLRYRVNSENFNIVQEGSPGAKGDGTVTCASAMAYSEDRTLITTNPCDHMGLCQNENDVYNLIRREWRAI